VYKRQLFDQGGDKKGSGAVDLLNVPEWPDNESLAHEKSVLGLYVSGHPLSKFEKEIRIFSSHSISKLKDEHNETEVSLVGMINDFQVKRSQKSGRKYGMGSLEDLDGTIGVLVFSRNLAKTEDILMSGEPVMATGKIEVEGDVPQKMILTSVRPLKEIRRAAVSAIHIKIDPIGVDEKILNALKTTFIKHRGDCPVFFHVSGKNEDEKIVKAHTTFNISPSENLVRDVSQILGQESIRYTIGRQQ